MRGKTVRFLLALALTAGLALLLARAMTPGEAKNDGRTLLRVWIAENDPALSGWLRSQASAWEKQTGGRVYLRQASREESRAAQEGQQDAAAPDLLLPADDGQAVALRGYALILRDENAPTAAPAPTGVLFSRPTPVPNADPQPVPTPDWAAVPAVLAPEGLAEQVPRAMQSADPAGDLARGRAQAALLTAEEAARLPFGFRAYALPSGAGFLPVRASAFTENGRAFLRFLLSQDAQRALPARGLYSPSLRLGSPDDPLRSLIENSRDPQTLSNGP